ncbi:MAG: c-type cytochrome [Akkermansiaceae bacterium]
MLEKISALLLILAAPCAVAQDIVVEPGTPSVWKTDLPSQYLVAFDFQSEGERGNVVVRYEGAKVFEAEATGKSQHAKIAINAEGGVYSNWLDRVQGADLKALAIEEPDVQKAVWQADLKESQESCDLGGDFTIAVKFRTDKTGTLVSKCAPKGKWTPNSKALFIQGGQLVYDIGWLGSIRSKSKVADGEWHHAVLVYGDDKVRLLVDGKLEAEKHGFTKPDPKGSVLKIGKAGDDFGGDYKGEIGFVRFWKRELPAEEIAALGQGKEVETNTPLLNWKSGVEEDAAATSLQFLAVGGIVKVTKVQLEPLAEVDHAKMIGDLDQVSFERGARIYNGLCLTCHGDQKIEGSLPTALRFHTGEFKNGKDPLSMYRTLTKGYNQMVAQPWMTPQQKHDVIHYIRESFLKADNPGQYVETDAAYLASLPFGIGTGPSKVTMFADNDVPKYQKMDFGPTLFWTLQVAEGNIAYKGIAVRLDEGPGGISKGRKWMLYDHDTMRVAAAWTGDKFIDWRGIAFDQSHGTHSSIVGDIAFSNPVGPGWGRPDDGSFEEVRFRGRDGKPYGPLPRDWAHYEGLYLHGNRAVIHYTVGETVVYEMPGYEMLNEETIFTRTLNVRESSREMKLRIAPEGTAVAIVGDGVLSLEEGFHLLTLPASNRPMLVKVLTAAMEQPALTEFAKSSGQPLDLDVLKSGGEKRWPGLIATEGKMAEDEGPFAVDEITLPWDERSPWNSWMRLGGFDFFADGKRAAVATWLGDVWIVDGLGGKFENHQWQRIATGLFQPLGVKIVDETVYVSCRDQIAELHDQNGDGEIDYVRNFNNDHQVTEHFHEFAMGLQRDDEGNFYYAKSARHAKTALVAHHGTLLKVSANGRETEIVATGFRAANGVCLNPDGSFIVTDQEGHWNPKNRINWVTKGGFYGNMFGYHNVTDESDSAMDPPLCWITNKFDRSPGELMWVPEKAQWGGLNGSLLNLSYGMGRIFAVPHEKLADGRVQGGMISLGMDFPTGIMRGRFHPEEGQLYALGMFAWAGNKQQDGAFYRIRKTGEPATLPIGLKAVKEGMVLTFTDKLDAASAKTAANYQVKVWGLKRTKNYGSKHYDERALEVEDVELLEDGKSVLIRLPGVAPTWCMEIEYRLKGGDGNEVHGVINNTVHVVGN